MAEVNTFYRARRANALGNMLAETMFTRADAPAAGQAVYTVVPASGKVDSQGVSVVARGSVVAGAAGNVTLNLRVGTTVAGQLLASSGPIALGAAGNYQFELRVSFVWDRDSQQIRGEMQGFIGPNLINRAINSGAITGFDPNGNVDVFVIASGLFGTSNAANTINLRELLSQLN